MISTRARDYIKEIVASIQSLGVACGCEAVYRDWCEMFALSIANGCDLVRGETWRRREDRYLQIVKKYSEKDVRETFPRMCAALTEAFEIDFCQDYLGTIYMELFGGNKRLGQCFTPIDVCKCCAELTVEPPEEDTKLPITINDCACGGGALLLAACAVYKERYGLNYQKDLLFYANDLDILCVHMCYIQLSLIGARAIVEHKNTITQQTFDRFVSPMEAMRPAFLLAGVPEAAA